MIAKSKAFCYQRTVALTDYAVSHMSVWSYKAAKESRDEIDPSEINSKGQEWYGRFIANNLSLSALAKMHKSK